MTAPASTDGKVTHGKIVVLVRGSGFWVQGFWVLRVQGSDFRSTEPEPNPEPLNPEPRTLNPRSSAIDYIDV